MEKVRLGKTGMDVSRIGFGGIPIQRLLEDDAVDVVKRCIELGIYFWILQMPIPLVKSGLVGLSQTVGST